MVNRRILVIGNLGYIGSAVVEAMRPEGEAREIVGFDSGLFEFAASEAFVPKSQHVDTQHYGDVRDLNESHFAGVDAVVYLAAISNDPMGREFSTPTHQINNNSAVTAARLAKAAGVQSFVLASSCSVYGAGGDAAKTETDPVDPLTDYAQSKLDAEAALAPLASDDFNVTCLRFATACGPSPRLRLDLVLNDFVASARTHRVIKILSDGTPLRPLIDLRDMGQAIEWAQKRDSDNGGDFLIVNTGSNAWNFSVKELAECVADFFGGVEVDINQDAAPDNRSYRVDFTRFQDLAGPYYPTRDIKESIAAIDASLSRCEVPLADFRNGQLMRLNLLRKMINAGVVDKEIRWTQ